MRGITLGHNPALYAFKSTRYSHLFLSGMYFYSAWLQKLLWSIYWKEWIGFWIIQQESRKRTIVGRKWQIVFSSTHCILLLSFLLLNVPHWKTIFNDFFAASGLHLFRGKTCNKGPRSENQSQVATKAPCNTAFRCVFSSTNIFTCSKLVFRHHHCQHKQMISNTPAPTANLGGNFLIQ